MQEYDYLIFDTVNTGYLVFNSPSISKENRSEFIELQDKKIYKYFFKNFIETVDNLRKTYLTNSGEIVFLIDNYESREELRQVLQPLKSSDNRRKYNTEYKSNRALQRREFYNTLDVIRYYYLIQTKEYHTARIPNLEADDLVPLCIEKLSPNKDKKILLISNDSDWCRYLDTNIQYLPELGNGPVDRAKFLSIHGYEPTEGKIILYKIIHGDSADNIPAVFSDLTANMKKYIMDQFDDIQDLMINVGKYTLTKPLAPIVKERELDIRLAFQMLSAIPVTKEHFNAIYTSGRNSITMLDMINKKIYGDKDSNKFSFGMSLPRLNP